MRAFFVHNREEASRANVKKSIISLTRARPDDRQPQVKWHIIGNKISKSFKWSNSGPGSASSILKPDISNVWQQDSVVDPDHSIISSSRGWQNITLRSRIYTEAHSHMTLVYNLQLEKVKTSAIPTIGNSLQHFISQLGEEFIEESGSLFLQHDKSVCHDCRSLASLTQDYEDYLREGDSASMQSAIAYLKIMNGLRHEGTGTGKEDILKILNKYVADPEERHRRIPHGHPGRSQDGDDDHGGTGVPGSAAQRESGCLGEIPLRPACLICHGCQFPAK